MRITITTCIHSLGLMLVLCSTVNAQLTPFEAVAQMERGINMGNTLEPPHEDDWNNPPAEEIYFDLYKEAGFDVVRVPVRWHYHTDVSSPFRVTETWMDRVEEVIDWGLSRDLFVVLNTHHEQWIKEDYANPVYRARFDSIWSQIAIRFKDKSEKLIFEVINEPHGLTKDQNDELHQRVLDIIRKTNPTRNVIIQGHSWGGSEELIVMNVPEDDYLIGSYHSYDPWPFGLEGTGSFGSPWQIQELDNKFSRVKNWSNENNIPVFLGEFACHKGADYNSRMKHYRTYVNLSLTYGFTFCAWDDGGNFGVLQRSARTWNEIKDILIYCSPESPTITGLSVAQDTMISLRWNIGSQVFDSVTIQRKIENGTFNPIASMPADSLSFLDLNPVEGKPHYYRIMAHTPEGTVAHSNPLKIIMPTYTPLTRGCFLGAPHQIPGTIEAEDFDTGGEGLTYHDMDSKNIAGAYRPDECVDIYDINGTGYHIGNALPGEWYEYSVQVAEEGEYRVDVHHASIYSGGSFLLKVGEVMSDTVNAVKTNSWIVTDKVSFPMNLIKGEQFMRFIVVEQPIFNIDKITFTRNSTDVQSFSDDHEFKVYQDAENDLIIQLNEEMFVKLIQVFHISGALVASHGQSSLPHRMSTNGFDPGIYLVRTYSGDRVFNRKIVIK